MYLKISIKVFILGIIILIMSYHTVDMRPRYNEIIKDSIKVNQFDSNGKKVGLWITTDSGLKSEIYYKNGLKNGIYKVYYQNGELYALGEYKNDLFYGTSYVFHELGFLYSKEIDFSLNSISIKTAKGEKFIPKYRSYYYSYGENGEVAEEGIILYNEVVEIESIRFGLWKFYNSDGTLLKIIDYKDEYLINY